MAASLQLFCFEGNERPPWLQDRRVPLPANATQFFLCCACERAALASPRARTAPPRPPPRVQRAPTPTPIHHRPQ